MKKSITLFFLLSIIGLVSSQNFIDKQKSTIQKDTVKKGKTSLTIQEEIKTDSLIGEKVSLKPFKKNVRASYYADKFHGKRTASGKIFNMNSYTGAHKKLPFGTKVKVTNIASGKSVIIEITDRGPFVKSREIDLSKRAFMEIAKNKAIGVMTVNIELVE